MPRYDIDLAPPLVLPPSLRSMAKDRGLEKDPPNEVLLVWLLGVMEMLWRDAPFLDNLLQLSWPAPEILGAP